MPSSLHSAATRLLCRRLVDARKAAGMTQTAAAGALGWPQPRLSDIERRQRRIDIIELLAIARVYRRPLSYFVDDLPIN